MKLFNHKMRSIFIVVALFLALFDVATTFAKENTEESWWQSERIVATGYGFPADYAENPGQAKILAKQAAMLDAYRKLAEQAAGIHITASQTLTQGEVDAVITGATVIKEEYDEYNNCTVTLSVPLYGVENSVAKAAFGRRKKEKATAPRETATEDKGNHYTGLIIDCSDLTPTEKEALCPVLSPTVKSTDGQSIYSADDVSLDTIVSKGMVGYADAQSGNRDRAGDNPLITKATALADNNTNPILTPLDADVIRRENRRFDFLGKGAVVLVGLNINVNSGATADDDGYV